MQTMNQNKLFHERNGHYKLKFGKFKDVELSKIDDDYLKWMLKNVTNNDFMQKYIASRLGIKPTVSAFQDDVNNNS